MPLAYFDYLPDGSYSQRNTMMKRIAIAAAVALASTLAFADDKGPKGGEAPFNETMAGPAGDYWKQHAKDGYLTKENSMKYKNKDGMAMDFSKVDTDGDGRISRLEWSKHHGDMMRSAPKN